MGVSTMFVVAVMCMFYGRVSAVDMTKLQPYNLTATVMFLQEDKDQDGQLSLAELQAVFNQYDTNGDGRESRKEYTEFICAVDPDLYQISHYLFDDYDVNGDHHLDSSDYTAWHNKLDTDNDGSVSEEEFVIHWVKLFEETETKEAQHQHGHSHEHGHC